jgi:hypothetical protein
MNLNTSSPMRPGSAGSLQQVKEADTVCVVQKHFMGDIALINSQARNTDNNNTLIVLLCALCVTVFSMAICTYTTYTLKSEMAQNIFIILIVGVFLDVMLFRNIAVLLISLEKYRRGKAAGYKKLHEVDGFEDMLLAGSPIQQEEEEEEV